MIWFLSSKKILDKMKYFTSFHQMIKVKKLFRNIAFYIYKKKSKRLFCQLYCLKKKNRSISHVRLRWSNWTGSSIKSPVFQVIIIITIFLNFFKKQPLRTVLENNFFETFVNSQIFSQKETPWLIFVWILRNSCSEQLGLRFLVWLLQCLFCQIETTQNIPFHGPANSAY